MIRSGVKGIQVDGNAFLGKGWAERLHVLPFIFVGAALFSARRQFIVKQIRGEETTGADKKSGQQLYMPVTGAGNQNAEGRRNRELRALPLLPTEVRLPHFCQDVACQRGILRQKGDYLFFFSSSSSKRYKSYFTLFTKYQLSRSS